MSYYMANPVLGKSLSSDWFFLCQDFVVRTVSVETVQPVYFCFGAKPANSQFATKTAKKEKNCEYCHSSQWNFQKKLGRLKFFYEISKMDEEDEHSSCYFYYPKDLETFDIETESGITECRIIKNLLTEFARAVLGAVLGNIDTRSWQYGPNEARSVLPRPCFVPQYGPRARLVGG